VSEIDHLHYYLDFQAANTF